MDIVEKEFKQIRKVLNDSVGFSDSNSLLSVVSALLILSNELKKTNKNLEQIAQQASIAVAQI